MNMREAKKLGRERGEAAASWVFDGNTNRATYELALKGIEDGDPEILDLISPPNWLSGEYAGESISELLGDDVTDAQMTAYEEAADMAFWRMVERDARRGVKHG